MYNPDDLTAQEALRCIFWSLTKVERERLRNDPPEELEAAVMQRDAMRMAESFAPAIVALLVERGQLEAGQNPLEVLKKLVPTRKKKP